MRKIGTLLIAALFLLLSACSAAPTGETSSPTGTPFLTPSALPPWETPKVSDTAIPEATPTASAPAPFSSAVSDTASPLKVLLPAGSVPETAYTPPSQPERYYADITKTLIPSKNYGHIWPYVGAYYTIWSRLDTLYGLCDEKGRVICEPIFHDIGVLEKDANKLYKLTTYLRVENESRSNYSKITLAKPDGSWADEYDEIDSASDPSEYPPIQSTDKYKKMCSWRPQVKTEFITVRKGDKWGAIDYNGKQILPCVYNAPLFFSEGLAAIVSDDMKSLFYINSKGTVVLGPYQVPPKQVCDIYAYSPLLPVNYGLVFYEGMVRFYQDGKFGVINTSGKVLIPAIFDYISSYSGGTAKFLSGTQYGVLDADGNVLLEPTDTQFYNRGDGTILLQEKSGSVYINLLTGERKEQSSEGSSNSSGNYSIDKNGRLTLKVGDGEKSLSDVGNVQELSNGNLAITIKGKTLWYIINPEGDTVAGPFDGRINASNSAPGFIYVFPVSRSDNTMTDYTHWVFDETGRRVLPGEYLSIQFFEGRYLVQTDTAAGLMDSNGNWVIKVPLYDYMGD